MNTKTTAKSFLAVAGCCAAFLPTSYAQAPPVMSVPGAAGDVGAWRRR